MRRDEFSRGAEGTPMKMDRLASVSRVTVKGIDRVPASTFLRRSGIVRVAPLLGRVVGGRYRLEAVLGRGSTSIVCKGIHLAGAEPVAVKVLSPVSSEVVDAAVSDRFQFEAPTRGRGDHVWLLRVLAQPSRMRFDGVEFLRADTDRGWGIASMARAAVRRARFS
ncbi:MAG TPA: hypothetical protein VHU80_05905 [Polyangiaceae bacterium]|jgi:hypothetical protein|nr:hypothetical protein [Polyangiaceae bacterium]